MVRNIILITLLFFLAACKGGTPPEGTVTAQQVLDYGLNPCHRIVVERGKIYYNGQRLKLNTPVEDWINVLGPYSRKVEHTLHRYTGSNHFWDKFGFRVGTDADDYVNALVVDFDLYMDEDLGDNYDEVSLSIRKGMMRNNCKYFFRGNILVDGAPLGRGTNIKNFLRQTPYPDWKTTLLPRFYNCEYPSSPDIPRSLASIYISHDYKDIQEFYICINYYN